MKNVDVQQLVMQFIETSTAASGDVLYFSILSFLQLNNLLPVEQAKRVNLIVVHHYYLLDDAVLPTK